VKDGITWMIAFNNDAMDEQFRFPSSGLPFARLDHLEGFERDCDEHQAGDHGLVSEAR
jgi:hypothetical protein